MIGVCKNSALLCLCLLVLVPSAHSEERFQVNVSFNPAFPINEFRENVSNVALGGSGDFIYNLKGSPFSVGASFGLMVYGSESRKEWFSADIPEVAVSVTTRNNIFSSHFLLRLQPPRGKIRPYLDGLMGFNYLWTETGVYDTDGFHQEIASDVNFSDWTWSLGIGGGLMLPIYERRSEKKSGIFSLFFDLNARYLKGGKAEYMKEGSIVTVNERVIYHIDESSTDLFVLRAGLTFAF